MTISPALLLLPAQLKLKGLEVIEMPGWRTRDETGLFTPIAILVHHDAMGLHNENVPNNMIRPGQYGAQIWISYTGKVYMLGAGLMYHAGAGDGYGDIQPNKGNQQAVGIETDYSGTGPWPEALLVTWRIVNYELAKLLGMAPSQVERRLAGHKEYAPGRKSDPANLDLMQMRGDLVADLTGRLPEVKKEVDMSDVVVMMKVGDDPTIWMVAIGAHTKWKVTDPRDAGFYANAGIETLSGPQAPFTIDDFVDITNAKSPS